MPSCRLLANSFSPKVDFKIRVEIHASALQAAAPTDQLINERFCSALAVPCGECTVCFDLSWEKHGLEPLSLELPGWPLQVEECNSSVQRGQVPEPCCELRLWVEGLAL